MADMISPLQVERIWTRSEVVFAEALAELDPTWGTTTFDLADGVVVLCGPGLFVNRALSVGLEPDQEIGWAQDALAKLELRSQVVGVPAAIEVTEMTHPGFEPLLLDRGYRQAGRRTALIRRLDAGSTTGRVGPDEHRIGVRVTADYSFQSVENDDDLRAWQRTAAEALGMTTAEVRRAGDIFARTAMTVDDPGLLIARSPIDGRPVGCATLKITEGIATLGGMSTLPTERRQGVQGALISHRLGVARERGCTVAVTMADTGSASERNLIRHGFDVLHHKTTFQLDISNEPVAD